MRINIYHHEMPFMASRAEEIYKDAEDVRYRAIRFHTEAPLIHKPGYDDSAGIAFWLPHKNGRSDTADLRAIAKRMLAFCDTVDEWKE
jgi:hypothetical protein